MKRIIALLAAMGFTCTGLQAQELTVKEFLRLSPSDTSAYIVKGVVSRVRSASSGSFYLQDETGTLLVYGLQSPGLDKSFREMDVVKGDTLTVRGREDRILAAMRRYDPVFMEIVPLSLEEIFISETEVNGYDIKELVL